MIAGALPEALPAGEVADRVKYTPRTIRGWVRAGRFPEPIDRNLSPRQWRWSAAVIDAYCRGEWQSDGEDAA